MGSNNLLKKNYNIFIVDDHPIFRYGLSQLINQQPDLSVCGEAEDFFSALKSIKKLQPDLAIVDLGLQGPSGIELIKDITLKYKKIPILVLSMHEESLYAERVLRLGAKGYIMKHVTYEQIIKAIWQVLNGKKYISEKISESLINRFVDGQTGSINSPLECLTDRELEVFCQIGKGQGTRQISEMLNLSIHTINTYKDRIKAKLNLENSSELVHYAIQWVQADSDPI